MTDRAGALRARQAKMEVMSYGSSYYFHDTSVSITRRDFKQKKIGS